MSPVAVRLLAAMVINWSAAPALLYREFRMGALTVADLRDLIPEAWTRPEQPTADIGDGAWVEMFRAAGFVSRTTSTMRPSPLPPAQPEAPTTLYRAAQDSSGGHGMSWTTDRLVAERLCHRYRGRPTCVVFQAVAPPVAVLGIFADLASTEVVVDPDKLDSIEIASLDLAAAEPSRPAPAPLPRPHPHGQGVSGQ